MSTITFIGILLLAAVVMSVIGEIWGTDTGKIPLVLNPYSIIFQSKSATIIYRIGWLVLTAVFCTAVAIMMKPVLSGAGWLWMILIGPASVFVFLEVTMLIDIMLVLLCMFIKKNSR